MRDWLWRGLALLLLAAMAAFLVWATEWADADFHVPAKGEAATNELYAAQAIARELGAQVSRRTTLDALPPAGATLVLSAWDVGSLMRGQEQALRAWVEQGGHLVIPASVLKQMDGLPVRQIEDGSKTEKPAAKAKTSPQAQTETTGTGSEKPISRRLPPGVIESEMPDQCRYLTESGTPTGPGFRVCGRFETAQSLQPEHGVDSAWALHDRHGRAVLRRVKLGQGDVTAIGIWSSMTGKEILKADHALLWVAALQSRAGMVLWFVDEQSRQSLLAWLWQHGWPALLSGILVLAAWLWRGTPRFGPQLATAQGQRRSMAEQIIGTAHFLARSDAPALYRAQLRALDEAAAPRLRHWSALDERARARAVAAVTGLPADALRRAMRSGHAAKRRVGRLDADLAYLETAVRRLRAAAVAGGA